jgi:hypothetical protein
LQGTPMPRKNPPDSKHSISVFSLHSPKPLQHAPICCIEVTQLIFSHSDSFP